MRKDMTTYQPALIAPRDDASIVSDIARLRQDVISHDQDPPVQWIVDQFNDRLLFIPSYQRPMTWSETMQSRFIESVILNLPIPYIFVCELPDGTLEIVDGSQ